MTWVTVVLLNSLSFPASDMKRSHQLKRGLAFILSFISSFIPPSNHCFYFLWCKKCCPGKDDDKIRWLSLSQSLKQNISRHIRHRIDFQINRREGERLLSCSAQNFSTIHSFVLISWVSELFFPWFLSRKMCVGLSLLFLVYLLFLPVSTIKFTWTEYFTISSLTSINISMWK